MWLGYRTEFMGEFDMDFIEKLSIDHDVLKYVN